MRNYSLILFAALVFQAPISLAGETRATASLFPLTRVLLSSSHAASRGADHSGGKPQEYIPAIIRVAPDAEIPNFVTVLGCRDDLVLVNVPAERISEVLSAPGILRMESGVCATPSMDMARLYCGLAEAQSGAVDLPRSFSGEGVVCGFTDTGFDPAHINFTDPASGKSRVKLLANYDKFLPLPELATSEAEIAAWTTDNPANWHATHVAGILAGGYNGSDAPYMGVAPAAEIAATTSSLNAPYLLAGCDRVVEYARSQGKPAVINMSISSFTGPRDGSTLFNEYMARIAEEAAVCVSAGNDGDRLSGYFRFTPANDKTAVEARILGSDWDAVDVSGVIDLWSLDSTPFSIEPFVWDDLEHRVCLTLPGLDPDCGISHIEFSSEDTPSLAALDKFECSVVVACETNPDNGRFNTAIGIEYTNNDGEHYSGPYDAAKSRYHVGFRLTSTAKATIDCHVSSTLMMMSCAESTAPSFSNALTINDFCCGEGVIAVGAMCTRATVPRFDSGFLKIVTSDQPDSPALFTSFGDTTLGALPHICAPGAPVISSISEPYIEAEDAPDSDYSAVVEAGGRKNHWGEASGTSMSSPFTAGVLALWLQADPSLSPAELKTIAMETASHPAVDPSNPRWGAGIIDALAGLRRILGLSSLANVSADTATAEFRLDGSTLVCTPLRAPLVSLSAHTPDGRLLASIQTAANIPAATSVTLPLPSSVPVIIAVAVTADGSRHSARLLSSPASR